MANADSWPPSPFDVAQSQFVEWDAWYRGDTALLNGIYTGQVQATHSIGGRQYRGGVMGSLSKMFLGQRVEADEKRTIMHLPIAADLAQLSADLLFSDAPKILLPKAKGRDQVEVAHPGQNRLDEIVNSDRAHSEMLTLGEYAASLGGGYLAVTWDADVEDHVFPRAYAADTAIPTFRHGRLVGVKLWTEYRPEANGRDVYRLIEEHHKGWVSFTLHKGGENWLGPVVPVEELEETKHYRTLVAPDKVTLAAARTDEVTIGTGAKDLAVVYTPNITPNREWRNQGALANLGRSDYDGVVDLMDKADWLWSSLFRDVDNGQGRLTVPESFLEVEGPGKGGTFDSNRQVYSPVGFLGGASDSLQSSIQISQFEIRDAAHLNILDALIRSILRDCGYSPSDFGEYGGGDKTATEITDRRADSERTRDKKALHARPALAQFARVAMAIDSAVFPGKGGAEVDLPEVEFAPLSQEDPEKKARTIQLLDAAGAISRETKIRMWAEGRERNEIWIGEELGRINAERQSALAPDPANFTGNEDPVDEPTDDTKVSGADA